MANDGCTPGVVANGLCSEPHASEDNSSCEAAILAAAAGGETATSTVKAGEAEISARSTAAAAAEAEATQAAHGEATAGEARTPGEPAGSKRPPATQAYYYAHAGLSGAAEDTTKFAKVTEAPGVVTGGAPILLGRSAAGGEDGQAATTSDAQLLSAAEAAAAAVAGKRLSGFTVVQSYMWTDDGTRVSVYVQLEKLPETPEERKADPYFDAKDTAACFEEECAALVIYRKAKKYLLNLNKLYFPIKPSESRTLIKNDKIVLRLAKEDENLTWFSLMKSK